MNLSWIRIRIETKCADNELISFFAKQICLTFFLYFSSLSFPPRLPLSLSPWAWTDYSGATETQVCILFSYVGVSIVLYIVSRFSQSEWRPVQIKGMFDCGFHLLSTDSKVNSTWFLSLSRLCEWAYIKLFNKQKARQPNKVEFQFDGLAATRIAWRKLILTLKINSLTKLSVPAQTSDANLICLFSGGISCFFVWFVGRSVIAACRNRRFID